MPTVPSYTRCAELGCNNPRSKRNRFCHEHGGRDVWDSSKNKTVDRRAFNAMYDTKHWKQLRIAQLSRQPLCQACLIRGIVTEAKHVDHLFPWAQIGQEAFKRNLFQSLCHECHTSKTHLEQRGICRHYNHTITDFALTDWARVTSPNV